MSENAPHNLPPDDADDDALFAPEARPSESSADLRPSADSGPTLDEPPVAEEDTRPRAPVVAPAAGALGLAEPPIDPLADTAPNIVAGLPARRLLLILTLGAPLCLCLLLVGFSGFAGYRDGLATNDARFTQEVATSIAEQYRIGVSDLTQGYAELAADRFAWIVETVGAPADFAGDSAELLATARAIASYTPTPPPTATPTPSPMPTPTLTPTAQATAAPEDAPNSLEDPAQLYERAAMAMSVMRYEEALEWLDALRALAPDYRAAEVEAMLIEALTQQGRMYLRGQNPDGADMLARGVLLIYRANDIRPVEPSTLLGEAIFVEMYINARNYVNGGYYDNALPILEELCAMNCGWGYGGVTVRDLRDRALAGIGTAP
ncbi:MAG: hypothetical protein OZ934_13485 [Anaerolineae bacterium]|nr:hypothetical protein [Anaerolineae bacterium]